MKPFLYVLLSLVCLLARAQENLQFASEVRATNAPSTVGARGTFVVNGNRVAYKFDTSDLGSFVTTSIHGPAVPGNAAPVVVDFGGVEMCGFNIIYCGFHGKFDLTTEHLAQMLRGEMYVTMDGVFHGPITFVGAYQFRATNAVQFTSVIDGWNPTNVRPRILRWGRANFGLTDNQLSYEISLPAQYGPYCAIIFHPSGWQTERPVINIGTLNCEPLFATNAAPTGTLEDLPRCVARGAVCVPIELLHHLLNAEWQLRLVRPAEIDFGFSTQWGSIIPVDSDSDGVPDSRDGCSGTARGSIIDADGCSIEQLVTCAGPWRNHGEYVNQVKAVSAPFVKGGLITESQRRALINQAVRSRCGQH